MSAPHPRAGQYGVVDGVVYEAQFRPDLDRIEITIASGQHAPSGATPRRLHDGTLVAQLPRSRADRLFEVETWALLHRRFPVKVDRVSPDGRAAIAYPLHGRSPLGEPVRDERFRVVVPPDMPGHPSDTWRFGGAELHELTNVQETVHEVPVS